MTCINLGQVFINYSCWKKKEEFGIPESRDFIICPVKCRLLSPSSIGHMNIVVKSRVNTYPVSNFNYFWVIVSNYLCFTEKWRYKVMTIISALSIYILSITIECRSWYTAGSKVLVFQEYSGAVYHN